MKRNIILAAISLSLSLPLAAQDLTLNISNIKEPTGVVYWSVYDNPERYKASDKPLASGSNRPTGDSIRVTLHELPPGEYAARLYHDANDNGELDENMIGLPTESYGFSNNAGRFGPASYKDAAVVLDGDTTMNIRMR
jgi:uncharacterized protein (DUF2141 family)